VESVLRSDHPPFTNDPRIVKHIKCEAESLTERAHKKAVIQAKRNAKQMYDTMQEQADCQHTKDLKAIREHTDRALAEAYTRSKIEIAAFKVDLKAQRGQCKANLEQDAILARRTPKKPRPGPIDTARSRHSESHSSSHCPSPSGSNATLMVLNADESHAPQIENSLTPTKESTAPILMLRPSAPSAPPSESSKLDDLLNMMATGFKNMGKLIDSKLEKALTPINTRLRHLENTTHQQNDICQLDNIYPTYGISNINIDSGTANYATPEQLEMLRQQAASKEYEDLYVDNERELEECLTEEECLQTKWREGDETVRREMIAVKGRDPDIMMSNSGGQAYNPIYVDSQDEGWMKVQTHQPIPGLVCLPTGQIMCPNPLRAPNSLPTIRGDLYAT
jgi:hypothetical protein